MKKLLIENYILVGDVNIPMESLSKEERENVSLSLQNIFMEALKYECVEKNEIEEKENRINRTDSIDLFQQIQEKVQKI